MKDSASTIIAMFIAGILLFIVPLVTLTDRNDNVTQENVKLIVEEFVTEIRNTGELTRTQYQDFSNKLYSIGSNTYEIEVEIKYLDENPGKKTMQANYTKIGENVYYSEYTTQILKKIGVKVDEDIVTEEDDTIKLKEGDIVYVAVRNEDSTTAQTLKSSFLGFSNVGEYVISASSSAMVTVNGEGKITEEITPDEMMNYEYKITYNANGGTGALGFQGKSYGVDINITNVKPTRTGYNFLGWNTNPTSQEVIYNPGDVFSINANITLYAVWEIKTFTVMYNANGGSVAPKSQIKTWDIDLRLSTQILTRTGYTFLGWSEDSTEDENPTYVPGAIYTTNATTTLFAVWKPHKYTITYDANGGENAPAAQIKTHDIILTLTSVEPTRTGYTFLGWSTNRAATVAQYLPGAIFTTEANTTLYAIWKIDTYKITYNANGGTGAPPQQIKVYGIDLELSVIEPTKTGYTFLGWNTDASATTATYKAGEKFTTNAETTLYAIWEINKYTIKYDPNRGTGEPANQTKTYGIDLILSSTKPTRTGYTFLGWSTSSTANSPTYISGATYTDNADVVLYAVWRINTYTISYNPNGRIGAPAEQTKTYGIDITLSTTKPTRAGYTFLGWDTNKTATTVRYTAGGKYSTNEHVTLYAVWDLNKYTISYNENSGSGAPAAQVKTHGVDLTLSTTKPTKTGYTFLGWSTDKNAKTASYIAGGTFTTDADTVLYAIWKINTYTIKYDSNGGSGAPASQTKTYGIDLELSTKKPTRTGYTFLGWGTTSNASTYTYEAGATFKKNEDTTLFAVWEINKYTISYDPNGGTGAPSAQIKTHNTRLILSTTKPTKTGYTFLGWSTIPSADSAMYEPGAIFTTNANTTLYAVWSINTYTITYNANGGTGAPSTVAYTYDASAVIYLSTTKPTRTGYTFLGWSQSNSAKDASYSAGQAWSRSNAAHYTLYAVWQANTYKITYDANGGSGAPSATTYTYASSGVTYLSSTKPTRTGYAFLGWSLSNIATSASYSAGQEWSRSNAADYTLYAVWQANTYTIKYDANGGSGAPEAQTKTHDVSISLSTTKPTKSGYIFLGWNTTATANAAAYQPGETYTKNGNVTLYAIWQIGTYTITYNRNGGTGTNISVSQNIGTAATIKPSVTFTAPSGRHFLHWNTKSDGTGTTYNAGASYTADKDVTLYAIWAAHTSSCYNTKYHKHTGNSTSGGGCYTVRHQSGGRCGGGDAMWYCWYCGTDQGIGNRFGTSHSSDCIYQGASNQNGCDYHDSESDCSDWGGYTITYSTGCGFSEGQIESQTLTCGGTP